MEMFFAHQKESALERGEGHNLQQMDLGMHFKMYSKKMSESQLQTQRAIQQ